MLTACGVSEVKNIDKELVEIPGKNILMLKTEVTQNLFEEVMKFNPSYYQPGNKVQSGENPEAFDYKITKGEKVGRLPVESVTWYEAVYFCNKLSELKGLTPVYAYNDNKNIAEWDYTPSMEFEKRVNALPGKITQDLKANGYRLPLIGEWKYAGMQETAKKMPNGYGFGDFNIIRENQSDIAHGITPYTGFRIVRSSVSEGRHRIFMVKSLFCP